eukprot:4767983-Prorocentrum_lima.AAC.1
MTSSLVGSEMCIRDSNVGERRTVVVLLATLHSLARRCSPGRRPEVVRCPVSYTHLTLPTICSV